MIFHWRAIRLLPDLVDGALDPDLELAVEVHMSGCARCRRRFVELQLSEALLRKLPMALAPLEFDPASHSRLTSLSRWRDEGLPQPRVHYAPPVLALASVAMLWLLAATVSAWSPVIGGPLGGEPLQLAQLPPEAAYLAYANTGRF